MEERRARMGLVTAMVLFGTIGVFVRGIPLSSAVIAMVRGLAGAAFLLLFARARGRGVSWKGMGRKAPWLALSGAFLGLNWMLLFEAFRYTTVAAATICYYLAPVLVVLVSPLLLGERLGGRRIFCVLLAFGGIVLVSGLTPAALPDASQGRGILLALGAACFYAALTIANKRITGVSAFDRTAVQLAAAGLLLLPYCILTGPGPTVPPPGALALLAVVAVVHTGVTYLLYFGSMAHLSGQRVSILSYVDPVVAVLCSVTLLGESLTLPALAGSVLVLSAAVLSEK